jgi:glycosyltransferase involved in cell wall biosynthesis
MTFEEASGKYSLMDCINLTAAKFQAARPAFQVDEQPAFPKLLEKARNNTFSYPLRRLILDISELLRQSNLTGIARVELELARQFVALAKITGDAVVLAAFNGKFFQEYMLVDMEVMTPTYGLKTTGAPINFRPGDQFLLIWAVFFKPEEFFAAIYNARRAGTAITFMIHDLIPIANTLTNNDSFIRAFFIGWSQILRFADRIVAVSRKVSRDVACYVAETSMAGLVPTRPLPVAYFALGCDALQRSGKVEVSLAHPVDRNTLVAAGTLAKHKRITELVAAMQILWAEGCEMRLLLPGGDPGKGGIRAHLSSLPEIDSKLFVPGYISNLGCPVIARDIEIFRETSGGDAFFFENGDARKIAEGLCKWLALTREQQLKFVPKKCLVTWRQSAEMLKAIMFNGVSSFSIEVGLNATVNLAVPNAPQEMFNL